MLQLKLSFIFCTRCSANTFEMDCVFAGFAARPVLCVIVNHNLALKEVCHIFKGYGPL